MSFVSHDFIKVVGASEHNLKNVSVDIPRNKITVITGVSGSGKSSLAFDTVLAESQRRFFYTLSNYSRQFLDLGTRPDVKFVDGLSPAISLEQNETQPSRRSTVATITDIGELLGVIYARFGEKFCPEHDLPTTSLSLDDIVQNIMDNYEGKLIAISSPIVENKKGVFRAQFTKAFGKGISKSFVDGKVVDIDPVPRLEKEVKHTIKLITDYVKVSAKSQERLKRAVRLALDLNDGYGEVFEAKLDGSIDLSTLRGISISDGCAECGYSWPHLDSRHFSANSLGKCGSCYGYGLETSEYDFEDEQELAFVKSALETPCHSCDGTGLSNKYDAIKVTGISLRSLYNLPISKLKAQVEALTNDKNKDNDAFVRVQQKVLVHIERLLDVGLDYVHLGRRVLSLSGGESQRLKLAGILSEKLRGVLYVLDEPSQGLHPAELEKIWQNLEDLRDTGNTVVIVDHDNVFINKADLVIDLGPGGGASGGHIQAQFHPRDLKNYTEISQTARALAGLNSIEFNSTDPNEGDFIKLKQVALHNLDLEEVKFKVNALNVVTGVSGAGKTSLVFGVLVPNIEESAPYVQDGYELEDDWYFAEKIEGYEHISSIKVVDRKPIAKSSVSMPATYLDCFKYLRDLYAKLPDAQIYGLTAKHFSFASDLGRCPECKGRGQVTLKMKFLADAKETCPVCDGRRYQEEVLAVKYKGYSLSDILSLTIDEVYELFSHHKQLEKRLKPAIDLGLGYLQFGQPSSSLSGGEAQRLKLVPLLSKTWGEGSLLVIDEPTRGLHFNDVEHLLKCVQMLVEKGATVIMVEHHSVFIKKADWVIDLGPGASEKGGKLVYQGGVRSLKGVKNSVTSKHLFRN